MKIKIYPLIVILFIHFNSFAQISKTDSLKLALQGLQNDSDKINTQLDLAKLYTRIDADTALIYCNNAIQLGRETNYYKGVANAYRQIGIIYYMKGDYEKAIDNFTLSLKTWKEAGDLRGVGRAYNNIAVMYKNMGQYDKALENYMKSSEIQVSINDIEGLANSNTNIANLYLAQGNFALAMEYSYKSLKSHEKSGKESEIALTLNTIGLIYEKQEDDEKALEYYNKALKISEKINDKRGMGDIYNNMGNIYTRKGKAGNDTIKPEQVEKYYLMAIDYFKKSLPLYSEVGYQKGILLSYNSIGEINLARKKFDSALEYFQKSLDAYEVMGDKNEIAETLINLGTYYNETQNYNKALKYYIRAIEIAYELNTPELISEIAVGLSKSYENLGQLKKALEFYHLYTEMDKRVKNDENIRNLAKQELRYQVDKKQREMEQEQLRKDLLSQEKIRQQSMFTIGALIALSLVALLAFFIFRGYRIKKRSNVLLEAQRDEILQKNEELLQLNEEITAQRELTEKQRDLALQHQKEITDSIQYAKRIQAAVLPQRQLFVELVPDYFIYFEPRDIVSGDFYWMKKLEKHIVVAASDCTGHGVPGAFMSLLGVAFLNEIVNNNFIDPSDILNSLRLRIIEALHQTWQDDEAKDGMDIALCVINLETKELEYAGAYNPLYLIRDNELKEFKADKMPIGIHIKDLKDFSKQTIQLKENDTVYLFSDGYVDQFGGETGGKYKSKQLKELLLSIQEQSMHEQKKIIDKTYNDWKGELNQLDDILIIGMRF